jgi:hypothetical protein
MPKSGHTCIRVQVAHEHRPLEIDSPGEQQLDARTIVLGAAAQETVLGAGEADTATPDVLWQGAIASDGTGPQRSYFVRLNVDGTAHCQCPAYYFPRRSQAQRALPL